MEVDERNTLISSFNNYNTKNVGKYITKYTHKYTDEVKYFAKGMGVRKWFLELKPAQRYIDFICIQENKPQIYDTFKAK